MNEKASRVLVGAAVSIMLVARAAAADDFTTCANESGDIAIAACNRAIASGTYTGNDLASVYSNRGIKYKRKGDIDRAIADYDQAIRLNRRFAAAFYNRGNSYAFKDQSERAAQDYSEAIRLRPNYPQAFNNRCAVRAFLGQLAQALADCNESLRIRPNNADTLDTRAYVHLKMKNYAAAIADYDAAVKDLPKQASVLYGRGLATQLKGDASGAADIAAAKKIKPDIAETFDQWSGHD
jgi:tetratricopeptide (TPR) repeat protein